MAEAKQERLAIKAMVAAKKKFKPLIKDKVNPFFKSRYADLADVFAAVDEALLEEGLIVTQPVKKWPDGGQYISTEIIHVSGDALPASTLDIPAGLDPQKTVAALTYLKRAALQAVLGIASEDDDDGEALMGRTQDERPATPKPPPAQPKAPQPAPPAWRGKIAKVDEIVPGKVWKIVGEKGDEFFTQKPEHVAVASSAVGKDTLIVILFHKTAKKNNECDSVDPSVKESAA